MRLLVKTMFGLEGVLAEEIRQLGGQQIELLKRAVAFEGDRCLLYRANLELRTALRVLLPIRSFRVRDEHGLYRMVKQLDWVRYLGPDDTLAIDAAVSSPFFKHSQYVALKAKDAIVDRLREQFGRRPSVI